MKNLLIVAFLTLTLTSLFWSCSKDNDLQDEVNITQSDLTSSPREGRDGDGREDVISVREELVEVISCYVSDRGTDILFLFKDLCVATRDDGHYEKEFFFNLEKDDPRPELDGLSIKQALSQHNPEAAGIIDFLCANDPGLTILHLGDLTSTEMNEQIYLDDGFDENDPNTQVIFYKDCTPGSTSVNDEPSIPTLIVRECETYLSPEELTSEKHLKTDRDVVLKGTICGNDVILYGPPTGPTGPTGGGGPEPCDCERDCEDGTENLHKFRARNDYESWRGSGEFLFYIIFANDVSYTVDDGGQVQITGNALDYVIKRYDEVKDNNQWMYVNGEVIIWDLDDDGNRMKYILYEDDGGKVQSQDIDLEFEFLGIDISSTISIVYNDGDDFIGESIIEYCQDIDPNGFEYHPSNKVDFTLNER